MIARAITVLLLALFCDSSSSSPNSNPNSVSGPSVTGNKERIYLNAIKSVYNLTIYPNNNYVIAHPSALPTSIFNPDVAARVHDFAFKLTGPLSVAEYFYGLTPNNYTYEKLSVVLDRVDFNYFVVKDRTAYTSINYVSRNLATGARSNATQIGRFRFDDQNRIKEIDNVNPYYAWGLGPLINNAAALASYKESLINETCTRAQKNCVGANQQYGSYQVCDSFLRTIILGVPDFNEGNSVVCRWWHSHLTYLRPEVHCSHVGPTGGAICVPYTAADLYVPFFPADADRLIGPPRFVDSVHL